MKVTSLSRRNLIVTLSAGLVVGASATIQSPGAASWFRSPMKNWRRSGAKPGAIRCRLPRADDAAAQRRLARIGQNVAALSGARASD